MTITIVNDVYGFIRKQFGERISGDVILSVDNILHWQINKSEVLK